MQLHEVSEIRELYVVDQVNDALADGWKIVAVVSATLPSAVTGDGPVACYVMGRKASHYSELGARDDRPRR
jgi:hypothetical protein